MDSWLKANLEELERRSEYSGFANTGDFIQFTGKDYKHISLITLEGGLVRDYVKDFIDYDKMALAGSIKERMKIFVNAVRTMTKYFYVDDKVLNFIKYGVLDEDEDDQ